MRWVKLIDGFLWLMMPVVSLVFITIDLTNDARIYLGVEHIAANYYPIPQGIDLAWEIKPIANRLTNYVLYKIATLFVPFDDHFLFGIAVKLLALLAIVAVAYYFSRKVKIPYAFLLVFYTFTVMANFCILQAEYWAALWAVAAIAMLVSESKYAWFGAGALVVWIFLLKGITGLLLVPVLCGAYLLLSRTDEIDDTTMLVETNAAQNRLLMFFSGFCAALSLFFLLSVTIWPNMIPDMMLSPQLARVGMSSPVNVVVWFIAQLIMSPLYIPVLLIGYIFGAIFFFSWVKYQDADIRLAYELMWIVPVLIVMIQSELFLYHYLAFVPSAVVTLMLCERESV